MCLSYPTSLLLLLKVCFYIDLTKPENMQATNRLYSLLILSALLGASCSKHDDPKPPVAEAGSPQTIQLPINSTNLTGSGASTNGDITSYLWTMVSGPGVPVIGQAGSPSTSVSGMIQGVYHFQLKVTDVAGLTGTDTTSVTVLAALIPPTANAGDSQVIYLPTNTGTLNGSGNTTNGTITNYLWTLISGPNVPGISQPNAASTGITGLAAGTYYFQLKVTDMAGLSGMDTTAVTVLYDVQSGLVAYYNFTGGNLNDSSGSGNNIAFNNATPTADRFGNPSGAYLFDGSSSYMTVPNSASLNPTSITLMAIFKVNGFYLGDCHGNQVLGKGSPDYTTPGEYTIRFSDFPPNCSDPINTNAELFAAQLNAAGGKADTGFVKTGQWYNVAFTYDGLTAKLFVNGHMVNSWSINIGSYTPNSQDLFIGRYEGVGNQFPYWFNGVIDEVRIYNRALPDGAVKQLSN